MIFHRTRPAALFASLLLLGACTDSTRVETTDLRVQVEYPATYAQTAASDAEVVLRSQERGDADTLRAGPDGTATFMGVIPGSYEISASRTLSASDALSLTGIGEEVQLNALLSSHSVGRDGNGTVVLSLEGSAVGSWVISQMYYTGSERPSGGNYFFDQFFEITNNSTDTLYADGLMLVNVHGPSGQINPETQPTPFQDDTGHIYAEAIWGAPGSGQDHPVAPGGSLVIAQQGIDHQSDPDGNPGSPVDLGNADFEMYVDIPDSNDLDSPSVPNMEMLHRRFGFYALFAVFGPAVALVEGDMGEFEEVGLPGADPSSPPVIRIPVGNVIDGVEALQNAESGTFKRLPVSVDAGFTYASGTYTGESVRRRVQTVIGDRTVYQDTNNSTSDFEILDTPSPGGS